MKTLLGSLTLLVMLLAPPRVHAQSAELARAEALFGEGEAAFGAQRYAEAADAFQQCYELMVAAGAQSAPLVLFNLGASLEEIPGQEREARDAYVRFLADGLPSDETVRERTPQVQARIRALDAMLEGSGDNEGGGGGGISPVGPILLGVGGAVLLAGGVLFAVTVVENESLVAMCDGGVCPTASRGAAEDVQTLAIATDALVIGGALIAATGLVLTFVLQESGTETAAAAACTRDGCVAFVGGSF